MATLSCHRPLSLPAHGAASILSEDDDYDLCFPFSWVFHSKQVRWPSPFLWQLSSQKAHLLLDLAHYLVSD